MIVHLHAIMIHVDRVLINPSVKGLSFGTQNLAVIHNFHNNHTFLDMLNIIRFTYVCCSTDNIDLFEVYMKKEPCRDRIPLNTFSCMLFTKIPC